MAIQEVKLCRIKVPNRNESQTVSISPLHNTFSLKRFSNKSSQWSSPYTHPGKKKGVKKVGTSTPVHMYLSQGTDKSTTQGKMF